jgi:CBS domain-containing protein
MKTVRDCYKSLSAGVDIVKQSAGVDEVVSAVRRDPVSRSVFVVNDTDALVGIIPVRQLLLLYGARYMEDTGLSSPLSFMAQTAADLMEPAYSVSLDDDLEVALRIAVQHELDDIPVVENGKVVGNLDSIEILVNQPPLPPVAGNPNI